MQPSKQYKTVLYLKEDLITNKCPLGIIIIMTAITVQPRVSRLAWVINVQAPVI